MVTPVTNFRYSSSMSFFTLPSRHPVLQIYLIYKLSKVVTHFYGNRKCTLYSTTLV